MKESHTSGGELQGSILAIAVIKLKPRRGNIEGLGLRIMIMTLHLIPMKRRWGNGENKS